jgi:type II secretory ATPase GspE/PulE/Tfp pilus assembly ATPase PilB-like protein
VPASHQRALISRLKILANLDIAERRRPQSGKILLEYRNQKIEYRIEVTPTIGRNEDVVLRILSTAKPMALNELAFSAANLAAFKEMITRSFGIVLVVGPTGSGKTTTLHSALQHINTDMRKIWTAEDPVEITQVGLRQVQVKPKIGFGFQEALRSFLRADPDVIMIGEMRDRETAKTAIEASLTGHLVFSTLHTNSAPEAASRLLEMGLDCFNFADALLGILAQRLVRRLCDHCKLAYVPGHDELRELVHQYGAEWFRQHHVAPETSEIRLYRAKGCLQCNFSGYRGRLAVHELMSGSERVKHALIEKASAAALRQIALEEGMHTLKMDGVQKVLAGLTDMQQVSSACA